jgi:hypothetical protein
VEENILRTELLGKHTSFEGVPVGAYSSSVVNSLCSSGHIKLFNGRLFGTNRTAMRAENEEAEDELSKKFERSMDDAQSQEASDLDDIQDWNPEIIKLVDSTIQSVRSDKMLKATLVNFSDALTNPLSLNERIMGDIVNAAPFRANFTRDSREAGNYRLLVNGLRMFAKQMVCVRGMVSKFESNPGLRLLDNVMFETSIFGRVLKEIFALKQLVITSKEDSLFVINHNELIYRINDLRKKVPDLINLLEADPNRFTIELYVFMGVLKSGFDVFDLDADTIASNVFFSLFITELKDKGTQLFPNIVIPFTEASFWKKGSLNNIINEVSPTYFKAIRDGAQKAITAYSVTSDINKDLNVPMRVQSLIADYYAVSRGIDSYCTTKLQDLNKSFGGDRGNPSYRSQRARIVKNWSSKRSGHQIIQLQMLLDPLLFCTDVVLDDIRTDLFGKSGTKGLKSAKKRTMMRTKAAKLSLARRQACIDIINTQIQGTVAFQDKNGITKTRSKGLSDVVWSSLPIPPGIIAVATNRRDTPQP